MQRHQMDPGSLRYPQRVQVTLGVALLLTSGGLPALSVEIPTPPSSSQLRGPIEAMAPVVARGVPDERGALDEALMRREPDQQRGSEPTSSAQPEGARLIQPSAGTGGMSGFVTDASTTGALSGVTIQVYDAAGSFVASTSTDGLGAWSIPTGLAAGTYYAGSYNSLGYVDEAYNDVQCLSCNPTSGTPIAVTLGATTPGINFALTPGGRIAGVVTDAGTGLPLAGIQVRIRASDGAYVDYLTSDGSGSFLSSGLPAGVYRATTSNSAGYINEAYNNLQCVGCLSNVGTPITVNVGSTTSAIDFALNVGGRVSGVVTDAVTGLPLSGGYLDFYSPDGSWVANASPNALGQYTTNGGLPTGTYYARTWNFGDYVNEAYDDVHQCLGCSVTLWTPIAVTAGSTTPGIDFALAQGGRISGSITDAVSGLPLSGGWVDIFDSSGLWVGNSTTVTSGNYIASGGLPAGTYYVRTANFAGYINEVYNDIQCLNCSVTSGTAVAVVVGATTSGVNFALTPGGEITGTVTDAGTGLPLSGISVRLMTSTGTNAVTATTDGSGSYRLRGLPTGTYYVGTSNSLGYINEFYNDAQCVLSCGTTGGTPIGVTAGAVTSAINFALTPGGRISGTITDATTGLPLSGITVNFYSPSGSSIRSPGNFGAAVSTNALGQYTSGAGLVAGTYYAVTSNSSGHINEAYNDVQCLSCSATSGTPIAVTLGATTPGINFALTPGGEITGTVTDAGTGLPLSGISVRLMTSTGTNAVTVTTDGSGLYRLRGLPTGTYYVGTSNSLGYINEFYNDAQCVTCGTTGGTPIGVTVGTVTSAINFALTPGGRISGTITDATTGLPLSGITVTLYSPSGSSIRSPGNFSATVSTNALGQYTSGAGLVAGTYYALISNSSGYINEAYNDIWCLNCSATSGTPISVTLGATTPGIDFALTPGGRVSGTVTDAGTGLPLSSGYLDFYASDGSWVGSAFPDASGHFLSSSGLPTGTYYARTWNFGDYVNEAYDDVHQCLVCGVTLWTPIAVTAGSTTPGIDFALAKGGRLSGSITDAVSGLPLSGGWVDIFDSSGLWVGNSTTVTSGNYIASGGLPAGTYYVRTANFAGYINEVYNDVQCLNCSVTSGTAVAVVVGATTSGVNFALTPGGEITGTVTDAGTGLPLSGITVRLMTSTGTSALTVTTDASGLYRLRGLPTGTYYVGTSNSLGYINEFYNDVQCVLSCGTTGGTSISVTAGVVTSAINFALTPGGRISGTITDATTGLPLSGITVTFYSPSGSSIRSPGNFGVSVSTNALGQYTSGAGLVAGTYYALTSNSSGYINEAYNDVQCLSCSATSGTPIAVTLGATTPGINFALTPGGEITGTVTDAGTGLPISGISVRLMTSTGTNALTTTTDGSGLYRLRGLPTGTYYVGTSNSLGYVNEFYNDAQCVLSCGTTGGTPVGVTVGVVTSAINFALTAGGRISGAITDASTGLPLSGITVTFYSPSGSSIRSPGNFSATVSTNALGQYTSGAGLVAGTYYAVTSNSAGYINEAYNDISCLGCSATSGTPIAVTLGATTPGINFALTPGAEITGTVTDAATGLPLSGISVLLMTSTGTNAVTGTTDSSGLYRLRGLPTGTYYVGTSNSLGYINEFYNDAQCVTCGATGGTPIGVTAGVVTSAINFALTPGGRISGTVTDATTGLPLTGITINFFTDSGNGVVSPGTFFATVNTNSLGQYTSPAGLTTGTYYVRTGNSSGYVNEVYNDIPCLVCTTTAGTGVAVTAGIIAGGVDFALTPGAEITGVVTNEGTGLPLSGISLRLMTSTGAFAASTTTDASGLYRLRGLPTGTYYVGTVNSAGYVNEFYNDAQCVTCGGTGGTGITVTAGLITSGINFALTPGGRVSGSVVDAATGLPLSSVTVRFYTADGACVSIAPGPCQTATTNASGQYALGSGLLTGSYYAVTSNSRGYVDELYGGLTCVSCLPLGGTPIGVTLGATTSNVDFQLSAGGRISGSVTDAGTGAPLGGVSAQVYTRGGAFAASGTTDAAGAYLSGTGLPSGQYRVVFFSTGSVTTAYNGVSCASCSYPESATAVNVAAPGTLSGINAQLPLGGGISGTVRAAGTSLPLSGVSVVLYESSGRRVTFATTSALGTFTRTGLPAGTYYAEALTAGYDPQVYNAVCSSCPVTTGTPIVVVGTATTGGIDFELSLGTSRPSVGTAAGVYALNPSGVTLRTSIDPNSLSTSTQIEYGTTISYGQLSLGVDAGSDDGFRNRDVLLSGLACDTAYHYRIVATNAAGVTHSRDDVFITEPCVGSLSPTVTTPTSASIAATTATLGGNVTSDGGSPITERGVVYSQTTTNSDPLIGGAGVTKATVSGTTGLFAVGVTGLAPATGHSFKAFATNAIGTSYTSVATFTTTCPTLALAGLPNGNVNGAYTGAATASGGTGPYTYTVTSGTLPGGLSLTASGAGAGNLTGTPTTAGTYPFEITATDTSGVGTCTGTQSYSVVIGPELGRDFFTLTPCRLLDTRSPAGPLGGPALAALTDRTFPVGGTCGIPADAKAISLNIAVTGSTNPGNIRLHPGGTAVPLVSAINFKAGQTRSNNAMIPLSALGELAAYLDQAAGTAHLILDVNGYFK